MNYCGNCGRELVDGRCSLCGNNTQDNNVSVDNAKAKAEGKGETALIMIGIPYILGLILGIFGMFFFWGFVAKFFGASPNISFMDVLIVLYSSACFVPVVLFPLTIASFIISIISLGKGFNAKAFIALILDILPFIHFIAFLSN